MSAAREAGRRDRRPPQYLTHMDGRPMSASETPYRVEKLERGEWITVSRHIGWLAAQRACDRLAKTVGFNYSRMVIDHHA